jgi:hypothetical protein
MKGGTSLRVLFFMAFLVFLKGSTPLWGAEFDPERYSRINDNWRITGYWRLRLEYLNFFDPRSRVEFRDAFAYPAILGRLGVKMDYPWIEGLAEGQVNGLWNLPGAADAYGPGAVYFAHHRRHNQGRVFLHQGYLRLKPPFMPGLILQAGRFDYFLEDEFKSGDKAMDFLRSTRIGQRLVGPFGFSHVWRAFDGVLTAYDDKRLNLTFTATHPTQGGFEIDGMDQLSHIDLLTGAFTVKAGTLLPKTEIALIHVTYRDNRGVRPTDNRSLAGLTPAPLNQEPLQIHTVGGHLLGVYPAGPGGLDALFWWAFQWGHWGTQRHRAFAYAVEGGYQLQQLPWKPWLRLGWFQGSGDPDPKDDMHETFFQILPTARLYAFFPFYNLMNNRDLFFQVFLHPYSRGFIRADYHALWLDEGADYWYLGAGATRRNMIFGYTGRNPGGHRSLAQVAEITFRHHLAKYLWTELYYAHAFGGKAVDRLFENRQADFFLVELNMKF